MSQQSANLGSRGEQLAADFLSASGYRIIARNYREKCGEIDIIARDGATHVFVEVKTRQGDRFGDPFEAITAHKQQQIQRTALLYLSRHGLLDEPARFDVVGVEFKSDAPLITHLKDAFTADAP